MEYLLIVIKQVVIMFSVVLVGILCYKTKIITVEGNKHLSNLLLKVVNPVLIFMTYQAELSKELLSGLFMSFILSILTHIIFILFSMLVIKKNPDSDWGIDRFMAIYSNCGFFGIPLINGVFGSEGVLYLTAYFTIFNFLTWTHGISMIKGSGFTKKEILNTIKSPVISAIIVGLILYLTNIRLPEIIAKPLDYIGSMNTPLGMLVAGITLGQSNIVKMLKNVRVLKITFLRLLIAPALVIPLLSLIPSNEIVFATIMICACCPAAVTGTVFALNFDKNAVYASEIFALSTVLSALTIPVMIMYIGLFR